MSANQRLAKRARLIGADSKPDVPSPCLSICRMDATSELCLGCFRTLDEIGAWGRSDDASKRAVWRAIAERISQQEDL
jgi:predicted Fe-S protein YdhL (DUF1289 family)